MTNRLAFTTLFQSGRYEQGAAALINSLSAHSYTGDVWCGVGGKPPAWYRPDGDRMVLKSGLTIRVVHLEEDTDLATRKPHFLQQVLSLAPEADIVIYCDPDIVLKAEWRIIETWCSFGVAAVADMDWNLPASSPKRRQWLELADQHGIEFTFARSSPLGIYCNAGFVGVPRAEFDFIRLWRDLTDAYLAHRLDANLGWPFKLRDQEYFNIALMEHNGELSLSGPEAMDFVPAGNLLSHAAGRPKTWDIKFIRSALMGRPPAKAHGEFLRYVSGELEGVSPSTARRRQLAYKVARLLGVFYQRRDY
jgi:hypothetical protein